MKTLNQNMKKSKPINNAFNNEIFIEKTQHLTTTEMGHVSSLLFYIHLINYGGCENFSIDYDILDCILNLNLKFLMVCEYPKIIAKFAKINENIDFYELHKTLSKYSFHGFSSAYLESIIQHGLDPTKKSSVRLYQKYIELNKKYPQIY